ncbi:DUF4402 domain-containing protein [Pseudorhodoferax sp. Leaf265]|uniref:DUF4402 domain-containing protein n=1 Tax=Pseudorhodoferax sp. Leaf265 TaxID=1736315 RepID=UPI0006FDCB77|nr:DUF4402 domain-containing protein [Pseudorhodoferax sp. Leaf265]KQP02220.1 hypothetical protein ASF45_19285 [Pseudorhodoferax sp. Leaf265]
MRPPLDDDRTCSTHHRRWLRRATLGLAVAVLVACGGGGDDADDGSSAEGPGTGPGTGTGTGSAAIAVDASPLRATLTADSARTVTQTVPLGGGTLSAIGADGAVYTLTVPNNALTEPTEISLTPLSNLAVDGLASDAAYGVQLGPEGAQFSNYVTLTITPPPGASVPLERQLPIGWSGTDNTVALAALDPNTREANLKLLHFSGYALLLARQGTNATLEPARHRLGGDAEARLQSLTAERLLQERQRQLLGQTQAQANLDDIFAAYDEEVLKPRIAAAGSSCAAGRLAIQTVLGRSRQRQLLGYPDDAYSQSALYGDIMVQTTAACTREEYALCRDEHIITRMLPYYLGLTRQAQLLGLAGSPGVADPVWLQDAEAATAKCLNFELQIDSQMVLNEGADVDAHTVRENVSARVLLPFNLGIAFYESGGSYVATSPAAVPLTSSGYSVAYPHTCASVNSTAPADATVWGALGFTARQGGVAQRAEVADFYLTPAVAPTGLGSGYSVTLRSPRNPSGCDQPSTSTDYESWVTAGYPTWIEPFADPTLAMAIRNWRIVGGDVMATKEFTTRSDPDASENVTVNTQLVLFHKPAP